MKLLKDPFQPNRHIFEPSNRQAKENTVHTCIVFSGVVHNYFGLRTLRGTLWPDLCGKFVIRPPTAVARAHGFD